MEPKDVVRIAVVRRALRDGTVRQIREAAGLSQALWAAGMGCSRSAVVSYEGGHRRPRAAVALRCADLLDDLARAAAS